MTFVEALEAPTPAQIDRLVAKFAEAQAIAQRTGELARVDSDAAGAIKLQLIDLVECYGIRHTEKSKRLCGHHNMATSTTGTLVTLDTAAVETFRLWLDRLGIGELSGRFFSSHISYSLAEDAREVLKTLSLGTRLQTKCASLVGLCFQVKTKNPSLKIDVGKAEKL